MSVPYENATSGMKARDELTTILRKFGCENVGFMDDFANGTVLLAFSHRGRSVQLIAMCFAGICAIGAWRFVSTKYS